LGLTQLIQQTCKRQTHHKLSNRTRALACDWRPFRHIVALEPESGRARPNDSSIKAFELAPKILAGIVNVNSPTVNDEIHAPMGGVRDSGWGRSGPERLKEFQDLIWINAHTGQRQYPI
jgi:hypothetical protein